MPDEIANKGTDVGQGGSKDKNTDATEHIHLNGGGASDPPQHTRKQKQLGQRESRKRSSYTSPLIEENEV